MDISTIGGIVAGFVLVVWGIMVNPGSSILSFVDIPSIIIVLGGTMSAVAVSYPLPTLMGLGKVGGKAFTVGKYDAQAIIVKIIELANVARREGLLALEEAVDQVQDDFLKKGVMLIVDGTDPELVKNILETELSYIESRHGNGKAMFDSMGSLCPAFGMVGTLIGLVLMLKSLDDPSTIGPSMAVALITTFYGSLFANLIFIPIAKKLGGKSAEEITVREIMIEGLLSIQAGENPRIIEEKLKAFLSPSLRKSMTQAAGGANE